jgi:Uma2 family endonuclease
MSIALASPDAASRPPFSVEDLEGMVRAGILREDARVELIEGEIVDMSPIGALHAACVNRISKLLNGMCGDCIISTQNAIVLDRHSAPQPDVALLRFRQDFYAEGGPGPKDVLLVIEVSDTTLESDRGMKARLYAGAGILEYWIANLQTGGLEIHRCPTPGGYTDRRILPAGQRTNLAAFPDRHVTTHQVFGNPSITT